MLKFSQVSKASCNFHQNLEVNLGSISKMIDTRSVLTGRKRADFVNRSTTTQTESCFLPVNGNPTTKSIVIRSHLHSSIVIGCNKPETAFTF